MSNLKIFAALGYIGGITTLGYVGGKYVQSVIESSFPPINEKTKAIYGQESVYGALRKKIRQGYEDTFSWKTRAYFYAFIGSQLPIAMSFIGLMYHNSQMTVSQKIEFCFHLVLTAYFIKIYTYTSFKALADRCPALLNYIIQRVIEVIKPSKVLLQDGREEFLYPDFPSFMRPNNDPQSDELSKGFVAHLPIYICIVRFLFANLS